MSSYMKSNDTLCMHILYEDGEEDILYGEDWIVPNSTDRKGIEDLAFEIGEVMLSEIIKQKYKPIFSITLKEDSLKERRLWELIQNDS